MSVRGEATESGGTISITAPGDISVAAVETYGGGGAGGWAGFAACCHGGAGGSGGAISLTSSSGSIFASGYINSSGGGGGGAGSDVHDGGPGGNAGPITIAASNGNELMVRYWPWVVAVVVAPAVDSVTIRHPEEAEEVSVAVAAVVPAYL